MGSTCRTYILCFAERQDWYFTPNILRNCLKLGVYCVNKNRFMDTLYTWFDRGNLVLLVRVERYTGFQEMAEKTGKSQKDKSNISTENQETVIVSREMSLGIVILRIIGILLIFGAIGWIGQLLFKRKQRSGEWESISNPPEWVLNRIKLIENKHRGGSSWAIGKAWYLKGRTYRYRITFGGQGGALTCVARKLRRGVKK